MDHKPGNASLGQQLSSWFDSQSHYPTKQALADAVGIPASSLRDYFTCRRLPNRAAREKLAAVIPLPSLGLLFYSEPSANEPRPEPTLAASTSRRSQELTMPEPQHPDQSLTPVPPPPATPSAEGLRYEAYMATALTGLERSAKIGVIFISDCVAKICDKFSIRLYEPRKATDPVHNAKIEDHRVYLLDREKVTASDLVIVLCEHPSFGAGQEIEIAGNATVPLILLAIADKKVSRMVTGTPVYKQIVEFSDPDDLEEGLSSTIEALLPHIEDRRKRMLATPIPSDLGIRVQELRKNLKLDPEELAREVGVSEQFIKNLENSPSQITNLSLIHISALCRVLKVPFYVLLGEASEDGHPLNATALIWARERGLGIDRLRTVLDFAARDKPDGSPRELDPNQLDALYARLEKYEKED